MIDLAAKIKSQSGREKTKDDRNNNIEKSLTDCTFFQKFEALQAEGRKGRKATANPDHDKKPDILAHWPFCLCHCDNAKKCDHKRPDNIDKNCSPWQIFTDRNHEER